MIVIRAFFLFSGPYSCQYSGHGKGNVGLSQVSHCAVYVIGARQPYKR